MKMKTISGRLSFFLVLSVLLIGMVSAATPLQELMSDSATNIKITMTQNTTTNEFYLNTDGLSFDEQTISIPLPNGASFTYPPFLLSEILSGIDLQVEASEGDTVPIFSGVLISEETKLLLNNIASISGLGFSLTGNITTDTETLNNLAQSNPSPFPMQGTSHFIKNGNNYTIDYSTGFGSVSTEYKNKVKEAIERGVNSINLKTVLQDNILPLVEFADILPVIQELGYEVSEVEFENAKKLALDNINYNIGVDLTNLNLFQDGTYQIPVTVTSADGSETAQKTVTLVLNGIVNQVSESADGAGNYVPVDAGVKEIISLIQGLQANTILTVNVQDIKPAEVSTVTNLNALKYFVITVSLQPVSGAQVVFTIDKSKISNPAKIVLYRWETATSTWTALNTVHTSSSDTATDYAFQASTEHFSTFMVGEDVTPSTSGGNNGNKKSASGSSGTNTLVTSQQENENSDLIDLSGTAPIDLTGAPITGGAIGNFLKSGWGVASLTFAIAVVLGSIGLVALSKRKISAKK
jgi:PGF-pre-PGF domain-containing protein